MNLKIEGLLPNFMDRLEIFGKICQLIVYRAQRRWIVNYHSKYKNIHPTVKLEDVTIDGDADNITIGKGTCINLGQIFTGKKAKIGVGKYCAILGHNVALTGYLPQEELINHYQKAKVYYQLSYRGSFGMALAEAMACKCTPVVTNRGALSEVVGNTGFCIPYGDPEATAKAMKKALNSDNGKKSRERIINMFSINKKEEELVGIIEAVIR